MSVHQAAGVLVQYLAQRSKVRALLEDQVNDGLRGTDYDPQSTPAPPRPEGWDPNDPQNWPPPAYGDPAGETATHGDRARRDLAELAKAEAGIEAHAKTIDRILGRTVFAKELDPVQRNKLGRSADGQPGCESCARLKVKGVPWWNPPDYYGGKPTDLAGALPRKMSICRACERFAAGQDPTRLPNPKELAVKRDTGYWPKRHERAA